MEPTHAQIEAARKEFELHMLFVGKELPRPAVGALVKNAEGMYADPWMEFAFCMYFRGAWESKCLKN